MMAITKTIEMIASAFDPVVVFPSGGACRFMASENVRYQSKAVKMVAIFKTGLWTLARSIRSVYKSYGR